LRGWTWTERCVSYSVSDTWKTTDCGAQACDPRWDVPNKGMNLQRVPCTLIWTHFVAALRTHEDKYQLLQENSQKGRSNWAGKTRGAQAPYILVKNTRTQTLIERSLSWRQSCGFADITLSDLQIHMRKYSQFGIARERLLAREVQSSFYVPNHRRPELLRRGHGRNGGQIREFIDVFWRHLTRSQNCKDAMEIPNIESRRGHPQITQFLESEILSHLKFSILVR